MLGLVDVDSGNLGSLISALNKLNINFKLCKNTKDFKEIKKILLPGVGSFPNFINNLKKNQLFDLIKEKVCSKELSIFGICVGFQALFENSNELEFTEGLGLIKGNVRKMNNDLILPHIGWNSCSLNSKAKIFKNIDNNSDFYFCHSYVAQNISSKFIVSKTVYGKEFVSAIEYENIIGVQFHPEKSQQNGLKILQNYSIA
tara:strand:- start:589 stop:1191 length:603 start_codon:yes stop_codon:yes gene_type:complete